MRLPTPLLLSLSFLLVACGDDPRTDPDAAGNPDPDASVTIDAAADPDAEGEPDGGSETLCQRLCVVIETCFGEGGPGCAEECAKALTSCTLPELETLDACASASCDDFKQCLFGVECVGGGESFCGDGTCDGDESCSFCPDDCGACECGDGTCSPGECATCAADCPGGCVCPHQVCTVGELLDPGCDPCVGQVCAVDSFCCENSWDATCVNEAETICGVDCPDVCGDGVCSPGEEKTCPDDCVVGPDVDAGVPPPPPPPAR